MNAQLLRQVSIHSSLGISGLRIENYIVLFVLSYVDGSQVMNCTFPKNSLGFVLPDNEYCGFTQSRDDDFQWQLGNSPTGTSDTGPIADHSGSLLGKVWKE